MLFRDFSWFQFNVFEALLHKHQLAVEEMVNCC